MKGCDSVHPARLAAVLGTLAVVAVSLIVRAVDLQVVEKGFLRNQGDARHLRTVKIPAHRGIITDRNGEPLAVSTPVDSVWANPQELAAARARLPQLARLLQIEPAQIEDLLARRSGREFVYLRRHVNPDLAAAVMGLAIPGVALQREYRRYYPAGEVAAHVVGFTNVDDAGQEGMELAFDEWLHSREGSKWVLKDRLGQMVEDVARINEAAPGKDLRLSIDLRIQYLAYRELKTAVRLHRARSGSVVILDVRSGEVLAMVNQPSYNPNDRGTLRGDRYRNRAVTDTFEPGSAVKPFTVAAALESGRLRPESTIDTAPGYFKVGNNTIRDLANYGTIDITTVIQKSSNVGASKIALALPPQQLWRMFSTVGFGALSGGAFPGEAAGLLTDYRRWSDIERATLAFGYGVAVTPLQLAQAYMVFADQGRAKPVSFVPVGEGVRRERVMSPRTAAQIMGMMEAVVGEQGTGVLAGVPGYRVAGKTGTVQKSDIGGYSDERYVAVFAGIAPASDPRLVAVVVINEPGGEEYYGGRVAAPVFAKAMAGALRLLGVVPDAAARHAAAIASARTAHGADAGGAPAGVM